MPRDPLIDSLVSELDHALLAVQTARKIAVDIRRASDVQRRSAFAELHGEPSTNPEDSARLRYAGVTVAEAAEILGVGEEQVRRLLRAGSLRGIGFGGRLGWRMDRAYIETVAEDWRQRREGTAAAREAAARRKGTGRPKKR